MLGLTGLLMDLSSETIHALLPVVLVTTLGASAVMPGPIEGVSEAAAHFGRRRSLDTIGAFLGPLAAIGLMIALPQAAAKPGP